MPTELRPISWFVELVDGQAVKIIGMVAPKNLPVVPQGLRAVEITNTFVSLAWDNAGDALTWTVYRNGGPLTPTAVETYTDNTVAAATTYDYQVLATNAGGSSALSPILQVTTAAQAVPAVPTGLFADPDSVTAGFVVIAWDAAADAAEWDVHKGGGFLVTVVSPTYTDNAVAASQAYSYQVRARNSSGQSALTSALVVNTPANTLPIWTLGNQSATLNVGVSLNLQPLCDDIDGQSLTFSLISGSVPGLSLSGAIYGNGSPTSAGSFPLTFRANDGFGNSDVAISFVVVDPDVAAPTVPSNVVATANGSVVTVTFTASTDASGISQYRVFRDGGFRANTASSPYIESGVPNGTYTYSVSAIDNSANLNESAQGSASPVVVLVAPPAPDTPIYAQPTVVSNSQINHSWTTGPSGAVPTSYELDRSLNGTTGWANRFTGLAVSFQDTGLASSTQYFYRLRALSGAIPSVAYATRNATTNSSGVILIPSSVICGSTFESLSLGDTVPGGVGATAVAEFGGRFGNSIGGTGAVLAQTVSTPTYRGNRAVYFRIPGNSGGGGTPYRCELTMTSFLNQGGPSTWAPGGTNHENFIGFALYIPTNYPTNANGAVHFQGHTRSSAPPTAGTSPTCSLRSSGGSGNFTINEEQDDQVSNQLLANAGSIAAAKGRWTRWVFHIRYNAQNAPSTGFIKVYKDGVLILDRQNLTTIDPDNIEFFYYKFGLYSSGMRDAAAVEISSYYDEIRLAQVSGNVDTVDPANY